MNKRDKQMFFDGICAGITLVLSRRDKDMLNIAREFQNFMKVYFVDLLSKQEEIEPFRDRDRGMVLEILGIEI